MPLGAVCVCACVCTWCSVPALPPGAAAHIPAQGLGLPLLGCQTQSGSLCPGSGHWLPWDVSTFHAPYQPAWEALQGYSFLGSGQGVQVLCGPCCPQGSWEGAEWVCVDIELRICIYIYVYIHILYSFPCPLRGVVAAAVRVDQVVLSDQLTIGLEPTGLCSSKRIFIYNILKKKKPQQNTNSY